MRLKDKVQQFESTGFQDPQQQRHLVTNTRVSAVRGGGGGGDRKKKKGQRRGKNYYTKFFGGKLLFEHLHPPTHTIFSSKNSQLAPSLPENFYLRNEKF